MGDKFEVAGEASDGEEGLQLIQKIRPDIVITDIRMPKQNGLDMIQKIKEFDPGSHVIIISGHDNFEYAQQAIRLGVADYILKPVHIAYFIKLLERVYTEHSSKEPENHVSLEKRNTGFIVKKILDYIHENYHQSLSQSIIAKNLNVTESYLSKLFKSETGMNYQDYILQYRMEKAKEYIRTTNLKIYEIAQLVGYEDVKYFHVVFKRYTGKTPVEFREEQN